MDLAVGIELVAGFVVVVDVVAAVVGSVVVVAVGFAAAMC